MQRQHGAAQPCRRVARIFSQQRIILGSPPIDGPRIDVELGAVEPASPGQRSALVLGDHALVGRPCPGVVTKDLFHKSEVESCLQQPAPLRRLQDAVEVVERPSPVAPRLIEYARFIRAQGESGRRATAAW